MNKTINNVTMNPLFPLKQTGLLDLAQTTARGANGTEPPPHFSTDLFGGLGRV